jgi:type II secretory pathway component GspD/PulD (secretin)
MKSTYRMVLSLVALLACSATVLAQSEPAPADSAATKPEQPPPAQTPTDSSAPAEAATPAPVAEAAPAATPAETNAAPAAVPADNNAAPAAGAADVSNAPPAGGTNALPQASGVIPLIVMDDVPLTDAIRNLARQASLNYMLDPKIGFGQADASGKVTPQPMVSIRWENVTATQALGALLANHNLQMSEDPKTKITRITVKDPAAPDPLVTRVYQLKYASPTNILEAVTPTLTDKRSKAVADNRTSQVVVLATEKEQIAVDKLIIELDTATKQVLIEAKLMETSINPRSIKGIDWTGTLEAQKVTFGNNLQQNSPTESLNNTLSRSFPKMLFDTAKGFNPATAFLDADGVSATISFLNQYSEAKVLSTPRTVTLDNETAMISVSQAYPIFKNTAGTQGSPGGSEVTYTNLGVILTVTPRISANNYVNLKVIPEVSRKFDTIRKQVASTVNEADIYDIRKVETRVMIPSGNTLVLGGLVQDDIRKSNTKVPLLGDMPLLGGLFRSDSKNRTKQNLIIFITPTIVQESDYHVAESNYLQSKGPKADNIEEDWSAWNSGKPKDWKKKSEEHGSFSEVEAESK